MVGMDKLDISIPVTGEVLLRVNGIEGMHQIGTFEQRLPLSFSTKGGEVSFTFAQKLWEEAVKDKGVGGPTPPAVALDTTAILQLLEEHVQSARNQRCECGWRPENASIMNPAAAQHRLHLAELIAFAGLSA